MILGRTTFGLRLRHTLFFGTTCQMKIKQPCYCEVEPSKYSINISNKKKSPVSGAE